MLASILLVTSATGAWAQNEGIGAATSSGGSRGPVNLSALGVVVASPDLTSWASEPRDLGNGRWADYLTGTRDGGTFTFMATRAGGTLDCPTLMRNASQNAGSHVVSNALYAPVYSGWPVIETANGVGLFCQNVNGQAAVFSVSPAGMSVAQQLSVRAMAVAIGTASSAASLSLPPRSGEYGLTAGIRLVQLGLVVPIIAGSGWTAATFTGNNGGDPIDQVNSAGETGRISVALSRITGLDCATSLQAFVTGDTHFATSPDWLASNWYSQAVIAPNGSFACLPLSGSVLVTSITNVSTSNDRNRVRALLVGLRLAAYSAWGQP